MSASNTCKTCLHIQQAVKAQVHATRAANPGANSEEIAKKAKLYLKDAPPVRCSSTGKSCPKIDDYVRSALRL